MVPGNDQSGIEHSGSRVRVKICGITRSGDAGMAASLGADAIGLVFVPASPRRITPATARSICRELPPLVGRVGLFMDASVEEVQSVLERVPLDWLQFHGSESADFCLAFGRPYIKAIAMGGSGDSLEAHPDAAAVLLDSHRPGQAGGTGKAFDWNRLQPPRRPWILAGGLGPDNVARAIEQLRPSAVDVSSGVEASPGIKDHGRMKAFMEAIR